MKSTFSICCLLALAHHGALAIEPRLRGLGLATSTSSKCLDVESVYLQSDLDSNGHAVLSNGLCLPFKPSTFSNQIINPSLVINYPDGSGRIVALEFNSTCKGFTVVNASVGTSSKANTGSTPGSGSCSEGQALVTASTSVPNRITTTTARRVVTVPNSCPSGKEKDASLCYTAWYGILRISLPFR